MTVLNTANKVYLGASLASGVYAGTRKVWGPTGRNLVTAFAAPNDRQDWDGGVGLAFNLGSAMTFNQIGLRVGTGTPVTAQRLRLFNISTGADLGRATVDLTGHPPGVFYYVPIPTVTLNAAVFYCLWAEMFSNNGYMWGGGNTTVRNATDWYAAYAGGAGTFDGNAVSNGGGASQFYGLDLDYR